MGMDNASKERRMGISMVIRLATGGIVVALAVALYFVYGAPAAIGAAMLGLMVYFAVSSIVLRLERFRSEQAGIAQFNEQVRARKRPGGP